ncbi:MAG: Fe-S cluster assembly protein SufD, partial [Pseudomonadota bacterium]
ITLLDGRFCEALSSVPDTVDVAAFSEANAAQLAAISDLIGRQARAEGQAFVLLNEALTEDGIWVDVKAGQTVDATLHVVNLRTQAGTSAPRVLIRVADNAAISVAEHHRSVPLAETFDLPVTELHIGKNSVVHHYRFAFGESGARQIGRVATRQEQDSRYNAYLAVIGGEFNRLDFGLDIQGSNCESNLYGLYMCRQSEHTDIHLAVDHAVPHCDSQEVFRGVAAEKGKAVFNGRIHIHPDAQKTNAELSNRNLLLSRTAEINTKPELEIYADDVKCAHGATVGQLDAEALFYLRSRGTPLEAARSLLSYGFINEVLLAIPDESLAGVVTPRVDAFFTGLTDG